MHLIFQEDDQTQQQQERSIVSFHCIDQGKSKEFNKNKNFVKYPGLSQQVLKSLPVDRLKEMQTSHYNKMIELEPPRGNFFCGQKHSNKDGIFAMESRKKCPDNSFQLDRIMKMSKPSSDPKTLHGTPVFAEKGYFEEESLDIGVKNNVKKVNVVTLTVFYVN